MQDKGQSQTEVCGMADCPSKECHNRLTGMQKTLFGEDGTKGVVGCLKSKVSKAALWTALIILGIPFFATGVKVWFGTETAAMRFADVQAVAALRERMSVHEVQFKSLCDSLTDIKKTLDEVRADVKNLERP